MSDCIPLYTNLNEDEKRVIEIVKDFIKDDVPSSGRYERYLKLLKDLCVIYKIKEVGLVERRRPPLVGYYYHGKEENDRYIALRNFGPKDYVIFGKEHGRELRLLNFLHEFRHAWQFAMGRTVDMDEEFYLRFEMDATSWSYTMVFNANPQWACERSKKGWVICRPYRPLAVK
jgi:hypothetical protein